MDEETQRYAAILKIKQARLFELDKQAATFGIGVPPQIEMERVSLRDELNMLESAIRSPARTETADLLGPAGRYKASRQDAQDIKQDTQDVKQGLALLLNRLDDFIEETEDFRSMNRVVLIIIGVAVLLILVVVVAIVTYLFTRGGL